MHNFLLLKISNQKHVKHNIKNAHFDRSISWDKWDFRNNNLHRNAHSLHYTTNKAKIIDDINFYMEKLPKEIVEQQLQYEKLEQLETKSMRINDLKKIRNK